MKKFTVLSMVLALSLSGLVGCSSSQSSQANIPSNGAGGSNKPKVVVVLKTLSSQYWKFVQAGAEKAFKDLNVDGKVLGPAAESQIMEQVNMMQDALNQNPNALVVSPSQPSAAIPTLQQYKQKGIPVLLVDTDAKWDDKTTFIGTDNLTAGKKAGELLASKLKKGDKVALIGGALGNPAMDDRAKGAKEALEQSGMVIVAQQPADSDKAKAMTVMENILQTHPDVKGVYAGNDDMAIGALRATKDKGLNIPVIGTDGTVEAVQSILDGGLAGTIAQSPYDMGYKGVEDAVKVIKGEKIDKRIDSGVDVITKDNAQKKLDFLKSISK
ncbi:sugar ABC transporter substrate-binding protein [Aneurinibacillus terranovensis]|uniref:sugar ABC transporter substrate-binding protein n=1 Tax=Aneurinibacillus terranovensis TaxID=278991 RepID=UPI00041E8758|nr:sugar ABC transporter substrate-binding protein [Aneurinibacillus terranovensis]